MGKKSGPAPPDLTGAATVEGEFARETARDQAYAQNADQNNALASSQFTQELVIDPASGEQVTKWVNNQTLSDPMQQQFDTQNSTNQYLADTANSMGSQVRQDLGTPAEFDQFGSGQLGPAATTGDEQFSYSSDNRGRAEDAAYQKATNRLDPRMEKERATLERQLTNRGLRAGDSAFDSAMGNFGNQSNDAYEQARLGSVAQGRAEDSQSFSQAQNTFGTNRASEKQQFDQGTQATNQANALRSQNIQEYLGKRNQSLKDQNALRDSNTNSKVISDFGSGG
jgi:hypothetical protein